MSGLPVGGLKKVGLRRYFSSLHPPTLSFFLFFEMAAAVVVDRGWRSCLPISCETLGFVLVKDTVVCGECCIAIIGVTVSICVIT